LAGSSRQVGWWQQDEPDDPFSFIGVTLFCLAPHCRWLYSNRLTALPPQLGQLQRLRKLWADRNQLASVPDELGNCSELQVNLVARYANEISKNAAKWRINPQSIIKCLISNGPGSILTQ
jgi:hypothetical protein